MILIAALLQAVAPSGGVESCRVIVDPGRGAQKSIYVACGQLGVWLGAAESVESASDPASGSVIVVTSNGGARRVRLVSPGGASAPQIADVTRDLAKLAGQNPDAPLTHDVDLGDFATRHVIAVGAARQATLGGNADTTAVTRKSLDLTGDLADAMKARSEK